MPSLAEMGICTECKKSLYFCSCEEVIEHEEDFMDEDDAWFNGEEWESY